MSKKDLHRPYFLRTVPVKCYSSLASNVKKCNLYMRFEDVFLKFSSNKDFASKVFINVE